MEESSTPTEPAEPAEKVCKTCGVSKPLGAFYGDRSRPDGHRSFCIECDKARKRTPAVREQSHRYYHSEKGKAAEQRYRESEKGKATRAAYEERPERVERRRAKASMYTIRWHRSAKGQANYAAKMADPQWREQRRVYLTAYRLRPEAQVRERAYHRAHGPRFEHRRRALRRRLSATFTHDDWMRVLSDFAFTCAYCGAGGRLTQDHFIPVSSNGPYAPGNIVPACRPCNSSKKDRDPASWCTPRVYTRIMEYLSHY